MNLSNLGKENCGDKERHLSDDLARERPHDAIKISFTGDLMCDTLTVSTYEKESGKYDFSEMFKACANYFASSDYEVGDIETPIENARYNCNSILFNLYLAKNENVVKPVDMTFNITKSISDGESWVKTVLLFDLINKCDDAEERAKLIHDNLEAYNIFRDSDATEITLKLEYDL